MKYIKASAVLTLLTFPLISSAQQLSGLRQLITSIGDIVRMLTVLAMAIALLVFLWGLAKFIFKVGGDEGAVTAGKTLMIWGLIALFVAASVWGIVAFMQRELGLPNTGTPSLTQPLQSTPNNNFIPLQPSIPSGL